VTRIVFGTLLMGRLPAKPKNGLALLMHDYYNWGY